MDNVWNALFTFLILLLGGTAASADTIFCSNSTGFVKYRQSNPHVGNPPAGHAGGVYSSMWTEASAQGDVQKLPQDAYSFNSSTEKDVVPSVGNFYSGTSVYTIQATKKSEDGAIVMHQKT